MLIKELATLVISWWHSGPQWEISRLMNTPHNLRFWFISLGLFGLLQCWFLTLCLWTSSLLLSQNRTRRSCRSWYHSHTLPKLISSVKERVTWHQKNLQTKTTSQGTSFWEDPWTKMEVVTRNGKDSLKTWSRQWKWMLRGWWTTCRTTRRRTSETIWR